MVNAGPGGTGALHEGRVGSFGYAPILEHITCDMAGILERVHRCVMPRSRFAAEKRSVRLLDLRRVLKAAREIDIACRHRVDVRNIGVVADLNTFDNRCKAQLAITVGQGHASNQCDSVPTGNCAPWDSRRSWAGANLLLHPHKERISFCKLFEVCQRGVAPSGQAGKDKEYRAGGKRKIVQRRCQFLVWSAKANPWARWIEKIRRKECVVWVGGIVRRREFVVLQRPSKVSGNRANWSGESARLATIGASLAMSSWRSGWCGRSGWPPNQKSPRDRAGELLVHGIGDWGFGMSAKELIRQGKR